MSIPSNITLSNRKVSEIIMDSPSPTQMKTEVYWNHWKVQSPPKDEWILVANAKESVFATVYDENKWVNDVSIFSVKDYPYWAKKPLPFNPLNRK